MASSPGRKLSSNTICIPCEGCMEALALGLSICRISSAKTPVQLMMAVASTSNVLLPMLSWAVTPTTWPTSLTKPVTLQYFAKEAPLEVAVRASDIARRASSNCPS